MLRLVLATGLVFGAGAAIAETQQERDARRASYIVGVTCNLLWAGQPGKVQFFANGQGELSHHEGGVPFTWSVKQDEYCFQFEGRKPNCSKWPARDIGDEERKVVQAVTGDCL